MKTIYILLFIFSVDCFFAQNNGLEAFEYNFTSFYKREKVITTELLSLTPEKFQSHPDFGILPKNAPKGTYIELIHKRTDSSRTFIDIKHPKDIAIQKGYGPMHFSDAFGNLIEKDFELYPTLNQGVFKTSLQPNVLTIDTNIKEMSISFNGKLLSFSKNLKLLSQDSNGVKTVIANSNWVNFKVGADGFYITDFFPNIDYYGIVNETGIKTNFKLKSNITSLYSKGYLIISDQIDSDISTQYIPSSSLDNEDKFIGDLQVYNSNGGSFTIYSGICYDVNNSNQLGLFYRKTPSDFEMLVDFNWLNNPNIEYPVVVDPTISTNASLVQASWTGSMYNGSCNFTNSCDYNLTVSSPANVTITDITSSAPYITSGGCRLRYGALTYSYLGCVSPSASGFYWYCNSNFGGTCSGTVDLWSDFSSCIPAPSCASYNMTFILKFYRSCFGSANCHSGCITSQGNWVVTVYGKTIETLADNATGNGTQSSSPACNTTQVLNPSAANGVGPYTYLWTPGGQTTSTKSISTFFLGTQVYSCQVTDACGVTRTATFNVTPACVLPVELVAFYGNVNSFNVNLFWETATETNASHYTLERSYDAVNFVKIAKINATGESAQRSSYSYTDTDADLNSIIYYRLKQYDNENNIEKFSSIISVEPEDKFRTFDIFPNPSNGIYEIIPNENYSESLYNIYVYNSIGEEVFNKTQLKSKTTLNLFDLPNGIYFLKMDIYGKIVCKSIIKE